MNHDLDDTWVQNLPALPGDDETIIEDPPPAWPLDVQVTLAMIAGKVRVWQDTGDAAHLDQYLVGRRPGRYNLFGNLHPYRRFRDEVEDFAHVLMNYRDSA